MSRTDHSAAPAGDDEPQPAAARRQTARRRATVVAGAAAVVLAGGGGYWATASDSEPTADSPTEAATERPASDSAPDQAVRPGAGAGETDGGHGAPGRHPSTQHPGAGGESEDDVRPGGQAWQGVDSYRIEGRTLTVTFTGGVCDSYRAQAKETRQRVTVGVRVKDPDPKKVCVKMAKRHSVQVRLDAALGEREVVDARNGDALPRSAAG